MSRSVEMSRKITYDKFRDPATATGSTGSTGTELTGSSRLITLSGKILSEDETVPGAAELTSSSKAGGFPITDHDDADVDDRVDNMRYANNKDSDDDDDDDDNGDQYDENDDVVYR